ncbi:uncharacterized protein LOC134181920 isoform X1 [Corticium candelabrum]|uniref:uncharacterized protein LOC134181920 isoform X1 n=1 Tax=Corticium candelabrum TaxID=121492 RepID=UPI002E25B0F8|nr:uncharacterized protein LOC134181920 isoform X1 [Corticium candelabrum]XP_062505194.1 uncharacterized protein LOC134181920 isoform X1 [Corticium candelabrum]XP_062505195.1 uncharacterized protein LOC134181920 isoform X1 [Corticium candelabrum]XP_062505196.1 uncharacterized protein LOC134181920 isoform X1 [Corticium candelabrum]
MCERRINPARDRKYTSIVMSTTSARSQRSAGKHGGARRGAGRRKIQVDTECKVVRLERSTYDRLLALRDRLRLPSFNSLAEFLLRRVLNCRLACLVLLYQFTNNSQSLRFFSCQPLSTSLPEPNAIGDDSATLETIASHSRERTDQSDCLIAADLRDLDTSVRHVEEMISTPVRSGKLSSRRPLFPSTLSPVNSANSPCPSVNCSSGSETDDESNEDQEPRRTADLKTLLTTLDESDQSSEDEYRYESDTDCTSSDDVDELDASYLDDITLSPSTHHASSHDIVDVTTSPVGSKEVLDDQLTVKDMIIPTVQFGISDKDSGGQMPTSSPSSGAIPVVRVSVQPIAITPITIFENDLENRLKLPRVVCDEDCILQLLGKTCRYPFCWEEISVQKKHIGSTLTLQWHCKKFHQGSWSSSARCKSQNGYPFFINNLLFAA